jgi:nicotinate-nucleotide adenylyltransferase
MARTLTIFGGTFDPVHVGHLIVARAAAEQLGLDRVTLMPTSSPPHKASARASGEHRLEMLRLAVADDPRFEVSDLELRREGPSYTYDTLQDLRKRFPGARLHWLIGADMLKILGEWRRAGDVVDLAEWVIAARPPVSQAESLLGRLREKFTPDQIERLRRGIVRTPLIEVSSTDVRSRVSDGLEIRYLVPDAVEAYISSHGLYRREAPGKA